MKTYKQEAKQTFNPYVRCGHAQEKGHCGNHFDHLKNIFRIEHSRYIEALSTSLQMSSLGLLPIILPRKKLA